MASLKCFPCRLLWCMGTKVIGHLTFLRSFSAIKTPRYIATLPRKANKMNISDRPEFKAILTPPIFTLKELFEKNNFEIRIAGGAVRDLLMGKEAADLDFASTATPTEMKEMFEKEGIRMLHKKGEEHGTITCRIDETNLEVTTLRVDVLCDGRRAEVKYTTDWQLDANRRDLTINSMFLDFSGTIHDYFNGIEDVRNERVAFVGNAEERIQEDYLRILRYFRFFGRISGNKIHDVETLDAIKRNKDGLKGISAERVWTELKRIFVGRLAPDVLECMVVECGLSEVLGLPPADKCDFKKFREVFEKHSSKLKPMTCLAVLVNDLEAVKKFHSYMKCSNLEKGLGEVVAAKLSEGSKHVDDLDWFKTTIGENMKPSGDGILKAHAQDFYVQLLIACLGDEKSVEDLENWKMPVFPISGYDLIQLEVPKGPVMREVLSSAYDYWQSKKWCVEKAELIEKVNAIKLELGEVPQNRSKRKHSPNRTKVEKKKP